MTYPVIEHEAIQPQKQSIKYPYRPCPWCGGPMHRRAAQCMDCKTKRPEIEQPINPAIRHIPLTQGKYAIVDAKHYAALIQWRWYARKVQGKDKWYATRSVTIGRNKEIQIQMHRLIMGVMDPKIEVDHKSPDETLNNTEENIRIADASKNQANRYGLGAASGYKGAHILRKNKVRRYDRWIGIITFEKVKMQLGIFRDPIPAALAYDYAAVKYFGDFARVNFPQNMPLYKMAAHRS